MTAGQIPAPGSAVASLRAASANGEAARLRCEDIRALPEGAVLIHGGMHKTGSTAVQNTLVLNHGALAEQRWLYPSSGLLAQQQGGHRHFFLKQEIRRDGERPAWARLREEIAVWPGRVLLSHELFFSPLVDPRRVAAELPGREIFLIAYLRHPSDFVESSYRQWLRTHGYAGSPARFARSRRYWMEPERLVAAWSEAIGAGHVLLRPYDREQFVGGSVHADFLHLLGVQAASVHEGRGNDSLNPRQALVHAVGNELGAPPRAIRTLSAMLGSREQAEQALASLQADPASAPTRPEKAEALQRLLRGLQPHSRVLDDASFTAIERRHLPLFQAALEVHGTPGDRIGRSVYADVPQDASFGDAELRAAIRLLLPRKR